MKKYDIILISCITFAVLVGNLLLPGCGGEHLDQKSPNPSAYIQPVVYGSLFNADEGIAVDEARVLISPALVETYTNTQGRFSFSDLPRGIYQLTATKGEYTASQWFSTVNTDYVSIDLTFGTTALNPSDISFQEAGLWLTKKIEDTSTTDYYVPLLKESTVNFTEVPEIAWSPTEPSVSLLCARTSAASTLRIYRYNVETGDLLLLTADNTYDSTDPSWSPNGRMFAWLKNGQIYYSSAEQAVTTAFEVIRDQSLIMKDSNGKIILRKHAVPVIPALSTSDGPTNVQYYIYWPPTSGRSGYAWIERYALPPTYQYEIVTQIIINAATQQETSRMDLGLFPSGWLPEANVIATRSRTPATQSEADHWNALLNDFWDTTCAGSMFEVDCSQYFTQGVNDTDPYRTNINLFDADNFPEDCPAEFKDPVWSSTGNSIAFLARPRGCTATTTMVCQKPCDDTSWDIFAAPIDVDRDNVYLRDLPYTLQEYEMMDKYYAVQITNDNYEDLNISWVPNSGSILHDKIVYNPQGTGYYSLHLTPAISGGSQARTLRNQGLYPYFASVSSDGEKIIYVSSQTHVNNPSMLPQIFVGDWYSGVINNARPVTTYTTALYLSKPLFYRIRERQWTK
jgi:hypothetical protein